MSYSLSRALSLSYSLTLTHSLPFFFSRPFHVVLLRKGERCVPTFELPGDAIRMVTWGAARVEGGREEEA